jgi:hypothetical protein
MPCLSTIMHGLLPLTCFGGFSGGYRAVSLASFEFPALVSRIEGFFGAMSA